MTKRNRVVGIALCVCLLFNLLCINSISASAEESKPVSNYGLASSIQTGNILHCSNTYFNTITDMLPQIADQGFSAVQVSPVQGNKVSINSGAYFCDWTFFYQPTNFKVGNELGTADEFARLCSEADRYGIKVIVDIVSNHMAQNDNGRNGILSEQIEEEYNDSDYFHAPHKNQADNSSRESQVQYNVGGLPDLDTSNPTVQQWVYDLLEECVSLGADGFRFDTAKHIETARDGHLSSDFWQNTAVKIQEKYKDLYVYGEVIDLCGTVSINAYTDVMNVTDAGYGIKVRRDIQKQSVASLSTYVGGYDDPAIPLGKGLVWVESHDEFLGGTTSRMSEEVLIKSYAAMASRKDSPTLFFARPAANNAANKVNWDFLVGDYSSAWSRAEVREVNRFKNYFEGESEVLSNYQDKYYLVQRGEDGVCIVNVSNNKVINIPTTLPDGSYKDHITGNKFTVSNGKISGKMADSGVAVIYNRNEDIKISVELNDNAIFENDNISFSTEEATLRITVKGAEKSTFKLAGNDEVEFKDGEEITFGKDLDYMNSVELIVTAENSECGIAKCFTIKKKDPLSSSVIYFDAPAMAFYDKTKDNPDSAGMPYILQKDIDDNLIREYPGDAMSNVESEAYKHLYKFELDEDAVSVKFHDGVAANVETDSHTLPPTECIYGDASLLENRIKGGYEVSGSMLWTKGKLIDVLPDCSAYPVYDGTLEVTSEEIEIDDKQTITIIEKVTQTYLYGDVNLDEAIDMSDVTHTQKSIAKLVELDEISQKSANVDGNTDVNLEDVVQMQRFVAKLIEDFSAGKSFDIISEVEITTETDMDYTGTDTIIDSDTEESDTDSEGSDMEATRALYFINSLNWDSVYAYFWEEVGSQATEWPGEEMEYITGNVYKIEIPDYVNVDMIIFNNGGEGLQTEDLYISEFGLAFEPTVYIGNDQYNNLIYTGEWDVYEP
ncbi:MAG: alpha-amylase family glycosyl hydrolase [Clostridia bacterium]|nr:alpha-amylase family glycosyl hydrolase [Clostridia bacterium]